MKLLTSNISRCVSRSHGGTNRHKSLYWFGPNNPYVQCGVALVFLIFLLARGVQAWSREGVEAKVSGVKCP
jgi:hypothetical protein